MSDPAAPSAASVASNTALTASVTPAAPAVDAVPSSPAAPAAWWDGKITEPEILDFAKAKNYATPEEALRAAWSANRMNKMDPAVTAVLEGKATPEQEAAFYNKLGRPENADKYDLKPGEGVMTDPTLTTLAKGIFHQLGATPAKAQAAYDTWNKAVGDMNKQAAELDRVNNEAGIKALETAWGSSLDANKAAGLRVLHSLGKPELVDAVQKHIGLAPTIELLAEIGKRSGEGAFVNSNNNNSDPNNAAAMTPQQAKGRIEVLLADDAFQRVLLDKKDPNQKVNLAIWEQLHAKAG